LYRERAWYLFFFFTFRFFSFLFFLGATSLPQFTPLKKRNNKNKQKKTHTEFRGSRVFFSTLSFSTYTNMRAAQVGFASTDVARALSVAEDIPAPEWARGRGRLLVRVAAVSLSPSDYRIIRGDAPVFKKPPQGFPYVPGGDFAGVVVACDADGAADGVVEKYGVAVGAADDAQSGSAAAGSASSASPFRNGDHVICTWDTCGFGALAELCVVDERLAAKYDPAVVGDAAGAAALANSAAHAMQVVRAATAGCAAAPNAAGVGGADGDGNADVGSVNGDSSSSFAPLAHPPRVLVIGASGGVGTHVVQLLHAAGVTDLVAVTSAEPLVRSLGASEVVAHPCAPPAGHTGSGGGGGGGGGSGGGDGGEPVTCADAAWWARPAWLERPFDVVIDCAVGAAAWRAGRGSGAVLPASRGGRWIGVVLQDWDIHITGSLSMIAWFTPVLLRVAASRTAMRWRWPSFKMHLGGSDGARIAEVLKLVARGSLAPVIDPRGPFPFTTTGVQDAFALHEARRGHGKIVIRVED
jgi:NADPH:quinone reductase-like Zn-dependent oxidoreductase